MCGIAGFLGTCAVEADFTVRVRRITDKIVHRGPDDFGVWVDAQAGVGLGSRRLAVVDLSPAGHRNWADSLWGVLMFEAWHERWA